MIITTCKHFVTNSVLNYQKNIKSSLERSKNDSATRKEDTENKGSKILHLQITIQGYFTLL